MNNVIITAIVCSTLIYLAIAAVWIMGKFAEGIGC
jgi:hypothetical protein